MVLALGAAMSMTSFTASATLIDFDAVASGTAIDTTYSALGVTFDNPLGGSIYAVNWSSAASPSNVVSVFQAGIPAFDARYGAVEAVFSTGQRRVSIDASILRLPEGLGAPINFPKMEVYDTAGNFITAVNWDFGAIPQPPVGGITGYETLLYTSASDNIGKVRFFSGQPGGSPSNFGIFDNLNFTSGDGGGGGSVPEPGTLALLVAVGLTLIGFARVRSRRTL